MESDQCLLQPIRSFAAGDAPSAAFVLVELHRAQSEFDYTLRIINYDDPARTQHGPGFHDRIKIHGNVDLFGGQTWARGSSGNDRLQFPAMRDAAAHVVDHLFEVVTHR